MKIKVKFEEKIELAYIDWTYFSMLVIFTRFLAIKQHAKTNESNIQVHIYSDKVEQQL